MEEGSEWGWCGLHCAPFIALNYWYYMMLASRVILSISALLAVLISIGMTSVSGYAIGGALLGSPRVLSISLAIPFAGLCAWVAVLKAAIAIALAGGTLNRKTVIGMGAFWLILLLFNWNAVTFVVFAHLSDSLITYGDAWFAASVLLMEMLSGCLPAVAYLMWASRRNLVTDDRPASVTSASLPVPTPLPDGVMATPSFRSVREFIVHVQQHGCVQFLGVRLQADGSLIASQRTYARVLRKSLGGTNAQVWAEHDAGSIVAVAGTRGTRLALASLELR